jgi:hypothetical protein
MINFKKEKNKILTLRIKNNIENQEWQELANALPVAEEAGVEIPSISLIPNDNFIFEIYFSLNG